MSGRTSDYTQTAALRDENAALKQRLAEMERYQRGLEQQLTVLGAQSARLDAVLAALQCNEQLFYTLVEALPVAVLIRQAPPVVGEELPFIESLKYLYINAAAEAITGYRKEEILQLSLADIVHPQSHEALQHYLAKLQPGATFPASLTLPIISSDGITRWLETTTREIVFQGCAAFLDIALDVTERHHSVQESRAAYLRLQALNRDMQRSRDLLRTIFDGISDGLLLIDQHGIILAANQAIATLLNCSVANLVNQSWESCCCRHGSLQNEAAPFSGQWALQTLHDGQPRQQRERCLHPDGTIHTFDIHVWPIKILHDGPECAEQIDQVVIRITDVTEKLLLEALVVENERLSMARELTQIVAHEVNTPLQSIITLLELMSEDSEEERGNMILRAQQQAGRIGTILHQLIDSYYLQPDTRTPVDVNRIVKDVLELMEHRLASHHIDVLTRLAPDVLIIAGEAEQMKQVLLNLVFYAIERMPDGGRLRVQTWLQRVTRHTNDQPAADMAVIELSDTGLGMDREAQEQLFMPFSMAAGRRSGPGLFIIRKVVAQFGGALSIESHPGTGTIFTIRVPLKKRKKELR